MEYVALQKTPTEWTRADIVYIASLVGGIFGKGGGKESANAQWWQALKAKFGKLEALRLYADLREENDAEAPTTSSKRARYDARAFDPTLPGVALPDPGGARAPGTGGPVGVGVTPDSTTARRSSCPVGRTAASSAPPSSSPTRAPSGVP